MRAAVFGTLALLLASAASSNAAEIPGVVTLARKQVESADYRMTGRLMRVAANGERTSETVQIETRWFPGQLYVLLKVTSPAKARLHVLFKMRPDGKANIEVAHPGDSSAKTLPFSQWGDGPLGGLFSYEDFLAMQYFWPNQRDLGNTSPDGRTCEQVLSTPTAGDETHFASVKSCLDPRSGFPLSVEKKLKNSGKVKEFTYFGVRQTQGVWWAHQITARIPGRAGSALLIVERGTPEAHLGLHDFDSARLTHF